MRSPIVSRPAAAILTLVLGVAAGSRAHAQGLSGGIAPPPPEPEPEAMGEREKERPWAEGVSAEMQQSALGHFREGNALLKESLFRQAAEKYRLALREWDHPGIHYNLALALLSLDQPLEVHEQLERALKFGPAPLDADKFEHAKSYLTLIEKQLAPIDVQCDVTGAVVSLDGGLLFHGPGQYKALIRPGPHTITAAKEGFPTTERTKVLLPGEASEFRLKVYSEAELIGYQRKWAPWKPVIVTVGGGVLLAAGIVMALEARSQFNTFDDRLRSACATGCTPPPDVAAYKDRGNTLQTLSWISFAAGGVATAAGVYLLYLNREIAYRIDPTEGRPQVTPSISVAPMVGGQVAGLVGSGRF